VAGTALQRRRQGLMEGDQHRRHLFTSWPKAVGTPTSFGWWWCGRPRKRLAAWPPAKEKRPPGADELGGWGGPTNALRPRGRGPGREKAASLRPSWSAEETGLRMGRGRSWAAKGCWTEDHPACCCSGRRVYRHGALSAQPDQRHGAQRPPTKAVRGPRSCGACPNPARVRRLRATTGAPSPARRLGPQGASARRPDGGTIFLDEVGETSAAMQLAPPGACCRKARCRRVGGIRGHAGSERAGGCDRGPPTPIFEADVGPTAGFRSDLYYRSLKKTSSRSACRPCARRTEDHFRGALRRPLPCVGCRRRARAVPDGLGGRRAQGLLRGYPWPGQKTFGRGAGENEARGARGGGSADDGRPWGPAHLRRRISFEGLGAGAPPRAVQDAENEGGGEGPFKRPDYRGRPAPELAAPRHRGPPSARPQRQRPPADGSAAEARRTPTRATWDPEGRISFPWTRGQSSSAICRGPFAAEVDSARGWGGGFKPMALVLPEPGRHQSGRHCPSSRRLRL